MVVERELCPKMGAGGGGGGGGGGVISLVVFLAVFRHHCIKYTRWRGSVGRIQHGQTESAHSTA